MIALFKLGGLLLAVVLTSAVRVPIAYVLLGGALAVAFLFIPLPDIPDAIWEVLKHWETWRYAITLWGILLLESTMRKTGMMDELATAAKKLFYDQRYSTAILPSIIGFLPSVGGAYFSAPLVEKASEGLGMSSTGKAFVNYWFRHIWENSIPLYPGILMAAAITEISIGMIMIIQFPLTIVGAIVGFVFGFWKIPPILVRSGNFTKRFLGFISSSWAIITAIILVLILPIDPSIIIFVVAITLLIQRVWFPYIKETRNMKLAMVTQSDKAQIEPDEPEDDRESSPSKEVKALTWDIIRDSFKMKYFLLLIGAVMFKELLIAGGAMIQIKTWFEGTGLNPVVVAAVLPFFIGMLVGMTPGFIGVSFPLLVAISGTGHYGIFALAYISGIIGVLFSPVHVCLILTKEFFGCTLTSIYSKMLLPGAIQIAVGFALWFLWG